MRAELKPLGDTEGMAATLFVWWITSLSWLLALGWVEKAVGALRGMPRLPDLTRIDSAGLVPLPEGEAPHLSVIVPACNEEESIAATLRSLLASTGLRVQIVAVNDRSTDRTGERMAEVAAEAVRVGGPHRLVAIDNRELPQGWLGKIHALETGRQCATAPWLLFTDGDVLFKPEALELALRQAMAEGADHLTLVPTLILEGVLEEAMQAVIQAVAGWLVRLWKVRDPRARDFFGVGGFTLIRSETLAALGGLERLRMEVVEDLSIGCLVKRGGFRSVVAMGPGLVQIRWIRGFFGIVGNVEKNGFAGMRYSMVLAAADCFFIAIQILLPLAALAMGGWALVAGVLTYAAIAFAYHANRRLNGISPLTAVLFAPCLAMVGFGLLRSVVLTLARDGVQWRGTLYPLNELRRNAVRWR